MAQGVAKLKGNPLKKTHNAHKASKNASIMKKGQKAIPPKKKNEVERKTNMKVTNSLYYITTYLIHDIETQFIY